MKYIYALFLFIISFLFVSCNKSIDYEVKLTENVFSPNIPFEFITNFDYDEVNIYIDNSPVNDFISPGDFYIKNLKSGKHDVKLLFKNSGDEITSYATDFFYDGDAPEVSIIKNYLDKGILKVSFDFDENDVNFIELYNNDTIIATSNSKNIEFPLYKDSGIINLSFKFYDDFMNYTQKKISINTDEDSAPVVNSDKIRINIFGDANFDFTDDWDSELKLFIKKDGDYFFPYEINPSSNFNTEILVYDSNNNFSTKNVDINMDNKIPEMVDISSRLISKDSGFISWEFDPFFNEYEIEYFTKNFGWQSSIITGSSFVEIGNSEITFVRKVSENGTRGFPSVPVFKFSSSFLPYASGILEDISENTLLTQINSPFIISSDLLLEKNRSLFVESGTSIRFFADSRLIIRGNLFVMPGAAKTLFFGSGSIIMDGGNLIISKADFNNINITGKVGKLIFLEDVNFENSLLDISNISRFISYNNNFSNTTVNLENLFDFYSIDSKFEVLNIKNLFYGLIKDLTVKIFNIDFKSKIASENSNIENLNLNNFSFFKSFNDKILNAQINNFSLITGIEESFSENISNNSGVVTNNDE
ncbi:hypothetical protein OF820_03015 [Oceanotoga sp. DSM 15011]|uniref:hypothetical protein n=1 Tax=Oceanotoga sp. DSM 15011 TaxID=2984951 RepID=UPI0021F3CE30|nr:hypothetical protein [Oceanotoga sp. DSM 15011]UYP00663.1 hypothetical protein OF820_03015 [Oceanotoga sp. DSM 15011]